MPALAQKTTPTKSAKAEQRDERLNLRVKASDRSLIDQAAHLEGLSTSAFLIRSATETAREVIAREHRITAPAEAFDRLITALEGPAEVKPRMLERLRRNRKRFG